MAFGSDNAKIMTGQKIGALKYFKDLNPFLIHCSCACHNLSLANNDLPQKIKYLHDYIDLIHDLHSFFHKSPKRYESLREKQIEFNEPHLNILRQSATRWISLNRVVQN